MVDRRLLIQQIDSLLSEGLSTVNNLLYIQKLEQNDARVTFFKHINTVLNSTVVSLIIAHKHLGEEEWWKIIHSDYELSNRPYDFHREFGYFDQVNLNGTFILVFISFEHSTRLICKQYNLKLFQEKESTINGIWKGIRKDLGINNRDDFIDLITNLRNSLHNNGLFVPRGKSKNRDIQWNGILYHFRENQRIGTDLWPSLVPITKEIMTFFNEIINSVKVKKFTYIPDPTEHMVEVP